MLMRVLEAPVRMADARENIKALVDQAVDRRDPPGERMIELQERVLGQAVLDSMKFLGVLFAGGTGCAWLLLAHFLITGIYPPVWLTLAVLAALCLSAAALAWGVRAIRQSKAVQDALASAPDGLRERLNPGLVRRYEQAAGRKLMRLEAEKFLASEADNDESPKDLPSRPANNPEGEVLPPGWRMSVTRRGVLLERRNGKGEVVASTVLRTGGNTPESKVVTALARDLADEQLERSA